MASVDGAKSVHASSDQLFDHICGSCKTDGKENEARKYCEDCGEYLCDSCVSFHRKLPLLRNHNVVDADMSPGGKPTRRLKDYCACNTNQEVEFYCEDHSDFICSPCKSIKHHKCTTPSIQQKCSGYTSASLDLILAKTKSLKDAYDRLKRDCQEDDKELERSKEACKEEIKAFRKELDDFLNKLEQKMLSELDQIARKESQRIDQRIGTLTTFIEMLDKQHTSLEKAQKDGSNENMFVAEIRASTNLRDCQTRLDDLEKNHCNVRLTFERNTRLDDLQKCVEAFGTLNVQEIKVETSNKTTWLGRQITSSRKVNVRLADDKFTRYITGCVFMPNGYLVACDNNNHNVKLFDSSLALHDSLKLPTAPNDVSVIDDNTVIVTFPFLQQLQYIQVFPQLSLKNSIKLDESCWGVAVYGQEIYISCHDFQTGEVRVLDKLGNLKRRLGRRQDGQHLFFQPCHLSVNKAGDKIFVSDMGNTTITCMKVNGSIVYQYKDKDLQKPMGLLCDDSDNIIVCDCNSKKNHVITSKGKKYGILALSPQNEKDRPASVAYRQNDGTLVIGYYGGDHMLACTLTN